MDILIGVQKQLDNGTGDIKLRKINTNYHYFFETNILTFSSLLCVYYINEINSQIIK